MNKQQIRQVALRNVLERRNRAIDRCDKLLAKLRTQPEWVDCETNLKQAQVNYVMNGKRPCDQQLVQKYRDRQKQLLAKYKVDENRLVPQFSCTKCQDTGYVGNVACECLQREIRALLVKDANVRLPNCTFSQSAEKDKHNRAVYKKAQSLCQKGLFTNVLLLGATGTGKTYLLSACANECLANDKSVLFMTAHSLNETFLECHLADLSTKQTVMENLLDVDALFIDDLGTENVYINVTAEYLFTTINERIARGKQTFVSTNLALADIRNRYDERLFSRLADKNITFIAQLVGTDKRI